jgi:hypothetical protein
VLGMSLRVEKGGVVASLTTEILCLVHASSPGPGHEVETSRK